MAPDERHLLYDRVLTLMNGLELTRSQRAELMKKHCQPNPLGQYILRQASLEEYRALALELNERCAAAVASKRDQREQWDRLFERRPLAKVQRPDPPNEQTGTHGPA